MFAIFCLPCHSIFYRYFVVRLTATFPILKHKYYLMSLFPVLIFVWVLSISCVLVFLLLAPKLFSSITLTLFNTQELSINYWMIITGIDYLRWGFSNLSEWVIIASKLYPYYQYDETNVMHFSFNLLRIKGLYMFRAGGATQTALGVLLVYVRGLCYDCSFTIAVKLKLWHSQLTLYARNIPNAVCITPPKDEQVMLETCRCPWFSINWMRSASRWFHRSDILWYTVSKTLSLSMSFLNFALQIIQHPMCL
jgi:hypothetical protein